jgi:hypothetical protein
VSERMVGEVVVVDKVAVAVEVVVVVMKVFCWY